MKGWPAVPGVDVAGHVTSGGFWHPGRAAGCGKCQEHRPARPRRVPGTNGLVATDCSCGHRGTGTTAAASRAEIERHVREGR